MLCEPEAKSSWSASVAHDPKHRPQRLDEPSTTVRKEWARRPQEAHVADGGRYRRLSADEIAIIQGFPTDYFDGIQLTTNEKIALLGNAVPPPLAKAIGCVLLNKLDLKNRSYVEICAGIGGLSAGFEEQLEPLAVVELWDKACFVLRKHLSDKGHKLFEGKAEEFEFAKLQGRVGLLMGGPPCQPWSQAGNKKGAQDPRDVMGATPEFVAACAPEAFLFENVPGLLSGKEHRAYVEDLLARLSTPTKGLHYGVQTFILNAADYGVPQVRKRVFILGVKDSSRTRVFSIIDAIRRAASHCDPSKPSVSKLPWTPLRDAIAGIDHGEKWMSLPDYEEVAGTLNQAGTDAFESCAGAPEAAATSQKASQVIAQQTARQDRIELLWPNKQRDFRWRDGKWVFEDATLDSEKRSLLLHDIIGEKALIRGVRGMSVVGSEWESLDALVPALPRQAALIYIDTPRLDSDQDNFANEVAQNLKESSWLSWLRQILLRARRLMDSRGIVVVHTNQRTSHFARQVLDELFGSENHVTTFAWEKKYAPQNDSVVPTDAFDYLITYSLCHRDSIRPARLSVAWSDLIDDGDYRGKFFAGHKGAKSGNESTKFEVNAPPYRWKILSGSALPTDSHFDPVSGILWIEKVPKSGRYEFLVEVTDKRGASATGRVHFDAVETLSPQPSVRVPWLFGDDKPAQKRRELALKGGTPSKALVGKPFSLVLTADGGTPFTITQRKPGSGRFWEFSARNLENSALEARVHYGTKGVSLPSIKKYIGGASSKQVATRNWLTWEDVGKSEDATRQLKTLAQSGIISDDFAPISKPDRLLDRLLDLFAPETEDIVIAIGDPNASLAARCLLSGRWFCHLVGPREADTFSWERVAKPRLAFLLAERDDKEPASIPHFAVSKSAIRSSAVDGVVSVNYEQNERPAALYAGVIGCILPLDIDGAFSSLRGDVAIVAPAEDIVDTKYVSELARQWLKSAKTLYVVAERWMDAEVVAETPFTTLLRAPYDLAPKPRVTP
jgi:DNA-cytosine methyltransferase